MCISVDGMMHGMVEEERNGRNRRTDGRKEERKEGRKESKV